MCYLDEITSTRTLNGNLCKDKFTQSFGEDFVSANKLEYSLWPNSTELYVGGNSVSTEYNIYE